MEIAINQKEIGNRIFTIRGNQVMIDRDLAEIYSVDTKVLNQAVKRNVERFPDVFRFQIPENEKNELVTICDRFNSSANSHDRFLIIDRQQLYHLGASLKDLGKKWFAFSRMDSLTGDMLNKLKG